MKRTKAKAALLWAMAMALCLGAPFTHCQKAPPPAPKKAKDTFRIGLMEPIMSLNPRAFVPSNVSGLVYDSLAWWEYGRNGRNGMRNVALESMKVSDDGKECLLTIHKGMLFHNGAEVTAADVVFSFKTVQIKSIPRYRFGMKYEILDKYTLRVTTDKWTDWRLLSSTDIINETYLSKSGEDLENHIPMGSGPYKFLSYDKKKGIVRLERWDKYWAGPAPFKYIEIHSFSNADAQTMALLEDRVDYGAYVNNEDIKLMKPKNDIQVVEVAGDFLGIMIFNHTLPKFSDRRVRRALSLLIPREQIVASPNGLRGEGNATDLFLSKVPPITEPGLAEGFNPGKAMKLFEEAGYRLKEGKLKKNGEQLRIEISFVSDDVINAMGPMRMVAKAWHEFGIQSTLIMKPRMDIDSALKKQEVDVNFQYIVQLASMKLFEKRYINCDLKRDFPFCSNDAMLAEAYNKFSNAYLANAPAEAQLELKSNLEARIKDIACVSVLFGPKAFLAIKGLETRRREFELDPYNFVYLGRPSLAN